MPRKKGTIREYTADDYERMYGRIEVEIDIEDFDIENVKDVITNKGYNRLGLDKKQDLRDIKRIKDSIDLLEDVSRLMRLRKDALRLPIYQQDILTLIDEKITNVSIATTEDFAAERGIRLTEKVIGKVEKWADGRLVQTIREKGSFKAYKVVGKWK